MVKMFTPGFPPRRPSGYIRYALVALIILFIYYTFRDSTAAQLVPYPNAEGLSEKPSSDPSRPDSDANSHFGAPLLPEVILPGGKKDKGPKPGSAEEKALFEDSIANTEGSITDDDDDGSILKVDPNSKTKSTETETIHIDDDEEMNPAGKTTANSESDTSDASKASSSKLSSDGGPEDGQGHPIDKLIYDAQLNFAAMLSKESKTVEQAAQAYRQRRGRHPPPGFDKWYEFASDNNAVIVEEFFDQIYHDLEPFWGLPPNRLRRDSWDFEMTIHVRNGNATAESDWFWTEIWLDMISTIQHLLPDMDLALNAMDEPRLVVPWEDIDGYMNQAAKTRGFPPAAKVISKFQDLPAPGKGDADVSTSPKSWEETKPYWPIVRRGCAPDSKARTMEEQTSFEKAPTIDVSNADAHSYEGFVSNFTLSKDPCHQADLQGLEGIFISPLSVSTTKTMFPMFGGSKLAVNNEILLPAPMYWNEEERFTGGDNHGNEWKDKADKVIWRGVATGGKNKEDNWRGFQRHRFVAMNNGTKVSLAEHGKIEPENFALPDKQYKLQAQTDGVLGEWINEWADVSFIDLMCDPPEEEGKCRYTDHYFHPTQGMKMATQFDNKYLPDIDGNSFSGRYLGFLRSTSLPIKAALWREWHDSRLVPWKHFVPMDSRFGDFYGIMEYFIGYNGKNGHDLAAEKIASEGKEWAEQVLRKEDMQIYVLRLLLEYARVLDDDRANIGWVDDLMKDPALEKQLKTW